jgi:hypothetical protein
MLLPTVLADLLPTLVHWRHPYELDGQGHLIIHAVDTGTTRSVRIISPLVGICRIKRYTTQGDWRASTTRPINSDTVDLKRVFKFAKGQGAWPAFWLLGANYNKALSNPGSMAWPETGEMEAGHLLDLPREFKDHLLRPWR